MRVGGTATRRCDLTPRAGRGGGGGQERRRRGVLPARPVLRQGAAGGRARHDPARRGPRARQVPDHSEKDAY